jgi:CheY-like chemotaxis protein
MPNPTLPLIIIADQDEDERCLLRAVLKLKGFNVLEAADGQQAINLAIEKHPDLLLVDLRLPGVSGAAAIRQIRKCPELRSLPIVTVSIRSNSAQSRRASSDQSTAHLRKPIEYDALDVLIERFLPGRRTLLAGI